VEKGWSYVTSVNIEIIECARCGMPFGVPDAYADRRRADHESFYCPSRHSNYFPAESEKEKFQRLYRQERERLAQRTAELDQTQASLSATKGVVTKQRKRLEKVVAGVCPVDGCKRHFADVRKHIATKHPEYKGAP
jgi:hypothetical protein